MGIRDATAADVPRVIELLTQMTIAPEAPRERDPHDPACVPAYVRALADIQADPRQRVLVVEEGGRVVATATLMVLPNLSHGGRPVAQLESVVVDERERGRGVGERLVRYCVDEARRVGCFRMQLTSNATREGAHRFYRRLGFSASHVGFKLTLG